MHRRRPQSRTRVRRLVTRRHAGQEDDDLFEERSPEIDGCGDERVTASEK